MEGTQAKREHKAHNVAHSSLYIWVNLFCFLQFNIIICLLIILFEKKPKNCKAPQFCIYHCLYFRSFFFVSETVFAMFAMGFNGFFSLFYRVLGGFWWVPIMVVTEKKYTYIYEEHSDRASNIAFFVCANLIVKVSWMPLFSKIANVV